MQVFSVAITGLVVSFVFSMVGAGGSQVMVPILFWFGLDFKMEAIPLALLESAVTCFSAGFVYSRKGVVDYKVAMPFAISALLIAPIGALANFKASSGLVMIVFAISNIAIGFGVLQGKSVIKKPLSRRTEIALGIIMGMGTGFFIGLIGRDGAPFILAALVFIGYDAREAAGSSAFIVAGACLAAFAVHVFNATLGWEVYVAGALACLVGSQLGSRLMSERLDSKAVRIIFTVVMVVVGIVILIQAL